jgi:hypothetical protein
MDLNLAEVKSWLAIVLSAANVVRIGKDFFNKPRLSIKQDEKKYPSIYAPARTYTSVGISRKYLRIHVENRGNVAAYKCKARLRVIRTVDQQYPAIEDVVLVWEGSKGDVNMNTTIEKDVHPNAPELLHVIFSDSSFPNIPVEPSNPIHAVISSKNMLDTFNPRIIEHGFVVGDFVFGIIVNTERAKCISYFKVHIDSEWDKLSMRKLSVFETLRIKSPS